jgi:hypothetical protein
VRRAWNVVVALAVLVPGILASQSLRGRVFDSTRRPIVGALIELRDLTGKSLQIVLTSPSGAFQLTAPAPGRYLYRVAAIGFQPRAPTQVTVPADGAIIPDVVLATMTLRLPDLVAVGHGRFCGKSGLSDDIFVRLLESARSALQIMETTVKTRQVAFQVAVITTATLYGAFDNVAVADTVVEPLARWPVESIDPDTLRVVGFGRMLDPGDEATREYYGPDARVLFSDWFLDSHCFTVDKPKKNGPTDSLHLRFAPVKRTRLIDVAGELVLDAHNLALLQFSFALTNLPNWMPDEAAGGYMEFSRLDSGLWMTKSWSIWAPRAGISPGRGRLSVAGLLEKYGWVTRVLSGRDTIVNAPHDRIR